MLNIHDEIDTVFGKAIEDLRKKHAGMPQIEFAGQVAGLLLATAIKMAKAGKCPRNILERTVRSAIQIEYGE
jgi:hypothetical protein